MSTNSKLLCIVGPTSSGKTATSLILAKKLNGEIISADSRQLYCEMNIGTSKIPIDSYIKEKPYKIAEIDKMAFPVVYEGITHYMIDVCNPNDDFSLSQFKTTAEELIKDIASRGKLPMLVGGTGLYINAVCDNLLIPEIPPDKKLRQELEQKTNEDLYQIFKDLDITGSKTIDRFNRRRLIRAIEISKNSDSKYSVLRQKGECLYDLTMIGMDVPRELIYEKISNRIESVFGDNPDNSPMLNETKALILKYNYKECTPLQGLTYKQAIWFLEKFPSQKEKGKSMSFEEAKELAKQAERNYVKRQLTWFRKDTRIKWLTPDQAKDITV